MPTNLGLDSYVTAAETAATTKEKEVALAILMNRMFNSATTPLGEVAKRDYAVPVVKPGTIVRHAGNTVPAGYLECTGASVTKAAYPGLFGAIGYKHGGSGDNFNLPNIRRRAVMGAGGARPPGSNGPGTAVGNTGGAERFTLEAKHIARHAHSVSLTIAEAGGHPHKVYETMRASSNESLNTLQNILGARSDIIPKTDDAELDEDGEHPHRITATLSPTGSSNPTPISLYSKCVVVMFIVKV